MKDKRKEESSLSPTRIWINGVHQNVKINKVIGIKSLMMITNDVTNVIFQSDEYYAPLREYAIRYAIVSNCTDYELDKDVEKSFDVLFGTDLFDTVCGAIEKESLDMCMRVINDQIGYEISLRMYMAKKELNDAVEKIVRITDNYEAFMDSIQKIAGPDMFELAELLKNSARHVIDATNEYQEKESE